MEFNESVPSAIARELREELGGEALPVRYVSSVEHSFEDGHLYHEINHVFLTELRNIQYPRRPSARERHLEFLWWPQERLQEASAYLLPCRVAELCERFLKTGEAGAWLTELTA